MSESHNPEEAYAEGTQEEEAQLLDISEQGDLSVDEVAYLIAALEADPGNWNTRHYLAHHYHVNGDDNRAIAILTTAPSPPNTEEAALFSAQLTARISPKRALHILDTYLVHHASSARAHMLRSRLAAATGDEHKAQTHERVAWILNPALDVDDPAIQLDQVAESKAPAAKVAAPEEKVAPVAAVGEEADEEPAVAAVVVADDGEDEVPDAADDVAPPGATPEEIAAAAAVTAEMVDEEDVVAPVDASKIRSIAPTGAAATTMHKQHRVSASEAAENPDVILARLADSELEDSEPDNVANLVDRQTEVMAALSGSSDMIMAKPDVKEVPNTGSKMTAVVVAIAIHVILAIILGIIVSVIPTKTPPQIIGAVTNVDSDTDLKKTEIQKPQMQQVAPQAQQVEVLTADVFSNVAMPTVDVSVVSPLQGMSPEQGVDFGMSFGAPGGGAAMSNIPPSMAGRCSMGQRMARLRESGATTACERAVRNALNYLKSVQNEDGSFGEESENPAAMTGLAILAYLGHCETPDSVQFGDTVVKAATYLLDRARESDGDYIRSHEGSRGVHYEHAMVTYALCEMYTMTNAEGSANRVPRLESTMKKAVRAVIDGQHPNGGWAYNYSTTGNAHVDASVAGWNFQALKAATNTGESISGLERALDKGVEYFVVSQNADGGIPYKTGDGSKSTLTPVGSLAFMMWDQEGEEHTDGTFEYMNRRLASKPGPQAYEWYYAMQAYFLSEDKEQWKQWNDYAMPKVLASQREDGSFGMNAGHGPEDALTKSVYQTALCTLMLEVYYRYLPTNQKNLGS